ncbi:MAG: FAD:protein FMN transferase [Sedimentisphaerales bacterium]|nr:FAD:protein FMN transferase [Sedimentisphaerales bacterium]
MKGENLKFILVILTAAFVFYLLLHTAKNRRPARIESPNRIVMDTVARIIAVAPNRKTAQASIDTAFETIYRLEGLMNRYDANSQLSKVNQFAAEEPVKVDEDLFNILQQSVRYSRKTDGAFDITVAPLIDLWKKCAEANKPPTEAQLEQIKKTIGYNKLLLDAEGYSVFFAVDGMKLDLGAIAKGFAIDAAVKKMKENGAIGGLVDIGGDIACFGLTEKKTKWAIGVQDPSEENKTIEKLSLSDRAVATSGDYRRFYRIGDRHFSHIFDPKTEKSVEGLSSVTVISTNAVAADVLATAVSVLGEKMGLEIIKKVPDTEVIIVKAQSKELIRIGGVKGYISD